LCVKALITNCQGLTQYLWPKLLIKKNITVFINDWKVVGPELFLGIAVQLLVVLGVWYGSRPPYSVLVRPIKALSILTTSLTLWLIARSDIYAFSS